MGLCMRFLAVLFLVLCFSVISAFTGGISKVKAIKDMPKHGIRAIRRLQSSIRLPKRHVDLQMTDKDDDGGFSQMVEDKDVETEIEAAKPQSESEITAKSDVGAEAGFKIPEGAVLAFNAGLWYLISAFYNIYNKRALNALSMPVLVATIQMGTGVFVFLPLWMAKIREAPFSSKKEFSDILWQLKSVATFTTLSHIAGVIALSSGTVSFTQVVKAAEPVFTAILAAIFTRTFLSWPSYLSLVPVVIGVSVVSANELTFSWFCLSAGFLSNIFAAARSVFGKVQMSGKESSVKKMTSENYYSMITIVSFLLLIPITLMMEGGQIMDLIRVLRAGGPTVGVKMQGLRYSLLSGVLFYLYNELSFKVLNKVNAVSHAIANTVKRVVIILSSVLVFRNPLNLQGQIGSAVSILGLFIYSLSETYAKARKQKKNEKKQ